MRTQTNTHSHTNALTHSQARIHKHTHYKLFYSYTGQLKYYKRELCEYQQNTDQIMYPKNSRPLIKVFPQTDKITTGHLLPSPMHALTTLEQAPAVRKAGETHRILCSTESVGYQSLEKRGCSHKQGYPPQDNHLPSSLLYPRLVTRNFSVYIFIK